MNELINLDLQEAHDELHRFLADEHTIPCMGRAVEIFVDALQRGNKIIACGNGGSLCDATHFAEELTGRYRGNRRSLPAVSINDPAFLTCTANDFSYEDVFARYVEGVGTSGDVLLAISTSGNSENVVRALAAAQQKGMQVVAVTVEGDNQLTRNADVAVCAPRAPHSDRIQEIHIKVIHTLIHAIETAMFGE
ncbi:MAG: SIS domain-containing protein [Bacteroidales bacterium]|nr:SIS domain-containing protein [Bacteroidales bacterium]